MPVLAEIGEDDDPVYVGGSKWWNYVSVRLEGSVAADQNSVHGFLRLIKFSNVTVKQFNFHACVYHDKLIIHIFNHQSNLCNQVQFFLVFA